MKWTAHHRTLLAWCLDPENLNVEFDRAWNALEVYKGFDFWTVPSALYEQALRKHTLKFLGLV